MSVSYFGSFQAQLRVKTRIAMRSRCDHGERTLVDLLKSLVSHAGWLVGWLRKRAFARKVSAVI